ncbi:MAG TPA: tetratricopeptide repeat protein [Candidatus Acidoferrum sp.]|nr:tetratricopeptide repeat protein [Candidatus Acidoferrum sp.]
MKLISTSVLALVLVLTSSPGTFAAQSGSSRSSLIQDHFRQASEDLKRNDPQSALEEFDAILALDPKNAEAHSNRGAIHLVWGDCKSATDDFRAALAGDASLLKAKAMLGICEKRLGHADAESLLASSFPKLTDKNLRVRVGMELATLYFQNGDLEHAAATAQSLVDLNPDNVDILYFAQLVYNELADETLNKLAIIAPGSARMQQVIAEHLVNLGDLPHAIEHYKKCLQMDPHLPGAHYELAEAIFQSLPSDPPTQAEAENELQTAIKEEGDSSRIECELARIALRRDNQQAAFEHYQRAFALNPSDVDAQVGLAHFLMAQGKNEEALKYLRMAVETDPLNGEAHYRLGTLYRKMQMPQESAKEMKLFQEIKQAKDRLQIIYREMNKRPPVSHEQIPDTPEQP